MRELESRRGQYTSTSAVHMPSPDSLLFNRNRTASSGAEQTALLIENEQVDAQVFHLFTQIIASRGQAIEGIESTIAELGQIYQVRVTRLLNT